MKKLLSPTESAPIKNSVWDQLERAARPVIYVAAEPTDPAKIRRVIDTARNAGAYIQAAGGAPTEAPPAPPTLAHDLQAINKTHDRRQKRRPWKDDRWKD